MCLKRQEIRFTLISFLRSLDALWLLYRHSRGQVLRTQRTRQLPLLRAERQHRLCMSSSQALRQPSLLWRISSAHRCQRSRRDSSQSSSLRRMTRLEQDFRLYLMYQRRLKLLRRSLMMIQRASSQMRGMCTYHQL